MTAPAEVKPATRGCSNYVHYRLILDTDAEHCPSCNRVLYRRPRSYCAAHSLYCCNECFSVEQIAEFARERNGQVFDDIGAMAATELAARLGISVAAVQDALGSACCLPDHHDWIKGMSESLKQSEQYLWTTMCQVWVKNCMPETESAALFAEITSKLS